MITKRRLNFMIPAIMVLTLLFLTITNRPVKSSEEPKPRNPWEVWDYLGKPVRGGEYHVASVKDVGLLNPHHWPVNNWDVIDLIFDQYSSSAEDNKMVPWMVESWEYPDPLTCIMKFKKDIIFHDGTPFNAEAVKYNIEWVMDKKNGCWDRSYFEPLTSIEMIDEYTIRFKFKKPYATFLSVLSYPPGYAISVKSLKGDVALRESKRLEAKLKRMKKKVAKLGKKAKKAATKGGAQATKANAKAEDAKKELNRLEGLYSKAAIKTKGAKSTNIYPVGSNAYIFDDRSQGNWIKVKRNPNWWYGRSVGRPDLPYFDSVKSIVIPDRSIQLANLKVGKIHEMSLSPSQYNLLKQNPHPVIQVVVLNKPDMTALAFNHAKGPCKDIRVRKAISHAIDRKALIYGALFGLARPASCIYPSDHWGHNPHLKPVEYDPEKSKKLLKEAGYEKGLSIKGHSLNIPGSVTIAEVIKNMLAEVGIDWKVDTLDSTAIDGRFKNLEYDIATFGWGYIFDPDLPATGLYHPRGGFNFNRSHNEKAIALIEAGRVELDVEKRQKIYWELEKALYDNFEDVWLWYSRVARGYHKSIRGVDAKMEEKHLGTWRRSHSLAISLWFKGSD